MKNKKFFLGFLGGVLSCLLAVGIGFQVLGANRNITVNDNIKVEFNGEAFTPKDANGKAVPVFAYDGTTYAPIRAICEAAGLGVEYDSATRTAKVSGWALPTPDPSFEPKPTDPGPIDPGTLPALVVTEEEAKAIALEHAGLQASEAVFIKVELDHPAGKYEVEFYCGKIEYEYDIDVTTGAIRKVDYDVRGSHIPDNSQSASSEDISSDRAKEIALEHASVSASDATFVRVYIDYEDGRRIYEVEFYAGNTEYDYELDAKTGQILSWDHDVEDFHIPGGSGTGGYIGEARAKEIALERLPGGTVAKCKLDQDDGRAVYELELYAGRDEFECEIDARTGELLKWEKDD